MHFVMICSVVNVVLIPIPLKIANIEDDNGNLCVNLNMQ